ncbi:unnamed protein product [Rhizopus stolonifer]
MKSSSCTLSVSHRDKCSQESSPGQSNDGDNNAQDVAVNLVLKNENDGELSPELTETSLLQEEEDDCLAKVDTKLELPMPVTDSLLTLSPTLVDYEKELQVAVSKPRENNIEEKLGQC